MEEKCVVNLRKPLYDGAVRGKFVATFDKGTDDIKAHLNRSGAVEDCRCHECAKLGEDEGQMTASATLS